MFWTKINSSYVCHIHFKFKRWPERELCILLIIRRLTLKFWLIIWNTLLRHYKHQKRGNKFLTKIVVTNIKNGKTSFWPKLWLYPLNLFMILCLVKWKVDVRGRGEWRVIVMQNGRIILGLFVYDSEFDQCRHPPKLSCIKRWKNHKVVETTPDIYNWMYHHNNTW